ncbi:MAG TPA: NUDIX domain-containing protein [Eudoraea sp.]|nr:NUDIX domain-containing protein [Eudoraea sp.]
MDELVDILDMNGAPTGQTAMKSEAHSKGLFHPSVHVWLYTKNGHVLIQQRGREKKTHPLLWDVSVAGHVGAGEAIIATAIREVEEEIGLVLSGNDLEKVGVFKSVQKHGETFTDCEFHHTYIGELKVPLSALKKQDSEVKALAIIPLIQLAEEVWGKANPSEYVPHEPEYYKAIIKAIKARL